MIEYKASNSFLFALQHHSSLRKLALSLALMGVWCAGRADVTRNITLASDQQVSVRLDWSFNFEPSACLIVEGQLIVESTGNALFAGDYDFWFELPVTAEWRNCDPCGILPTVNTYFDWALSVREILRRTGNGDAIWGPGEHITLDGIRVYHRRRVNPRNHINPPEAFRSGLLFSRQDRNRDFRIQADEIEQVAKAWRAGTLADDGLLETIHFHRSTAYLCDLTLGRWRIFADNARD